MPIAPYEKISDADESADHKAIITPLEFEGNALFPLAHKILAADTTFSEVVNLGLSLC
jgi:hypothetical protein